MNVGFRALGEAILRGELAGQLAGENEGCEVMVVERADGRFAVVLHLEDGGFELLSGGLSSYRCAADAAADTAEEWIAETEEEAESLADHARTL